MKGILLGQFLYTKFNDYVLKITRDKLVHRLVADGERCSRGGRRGPVLGRRPAAAARPPAERSVLLRPPPPAAAPTPGVAWTAALRQQVSWAPPTHWELNQHWSRRLVDVSGGSVFTFLSLKWSHSITLFSKHLFANDVCIFVALTLVIVSVCGFHCSILMITTSYNVTSHYRL